MITKTKRYLWICCGSIMLAVGLYWASGGSTSLAVSATVYSLWWSTTVPPYFRNARPNLKKDTAWATKVSKGLLLAIPVLGLVLSIPVYATIAVATLDVSGAALDALATMLLALPFASATAYLHVSWEVHDMASES
jgi:hypothetical protein